MGGGRTEAGISRGGKVKRCKGQRWAVEEEDEAEEGRRRCEKGQRWKGPEVGSTKNGGGKGGKRQDGKA